MIRNYIESNEDPNNIIMKSKCYECLKEYNNNELLYIYVRAYLYEQLCMRCFNIYHQIN